MINACIPAAALLLISATASAAQAVSPAALPSPTATVDVAASPACRALAREMAAAVLGQPLAPAQNGGQRAAGTTVSIAAVAGPKLLVGVGGGVAGGLAAEFLRAAESEARARAEEAQMNAINALSAQVETLDERMTAAGCVQP